MKEFSANATQWFRLENKKNTQRQNRNTFSLVFNTSEAKLALFLPLTFHLRTRLLVLRMAFWVISKYGKVAEIRISGLLPAEKSPSSDYLTYLTK